MIRREHDLHERRLLSEYPSFYAHIPSRKTGVPICASRFRRQSACALRLARRVFQRGAAHVGIRLRPRIQNFHEDATYWRTPEVRRTIEGVLLSTDSLVCDILGRERGSDVVARWFRDASSVPAQVIGSMFIHQSYHSGLAAHLREMRRS